jgi:hypothetical protein
MLSLRLDISEKNLPELKGHLATLLPGVKPSFRCEALARGLGFRTYASLLAELRNRSVVNCGVDGSGFRTFLMQREFSAPEKAMFEVCAIEALRNVAEKVPQLTMWGMGSGRPQRKPNGMKENIYESSQRFLKEREALVSAEAVGGFLRSICFLSQVKQTKTIRPKTGSYWIKHIAEKFPCRYPDGMELGPDYVANGTLIAAAIHLGFKFKTHFDESGYLTPNVSFNMSEPFLADLDCVYRPDGAKAQDRRRAEERVRLRRQYGQRADLF